MALHQQQAVDLLARLVEERPNTLAGIAEDCHGSYCIYCGRRGWENHTRPDHSRDCPIEQGQKLLERIYGDQPLY